MAKGEIAVDEKICKGCGYCEKFCPRGSISMSESRFNAQGFLLPDFSKPETCNACGVCGWLCPTLAITVYKYRTSSPKTPALTP